MDDFEIQPLTKVPSMVVKLEILDSSGEPVVGKFKIQNGANEFKCRATFIDGSKAHYSPFWTCPIALNNGTADFYGVLGKEIRETVSINASPNHYRYTELTCWVKFPDGANTDAGQFPHATIGFDYSEIEVQNA